MVPDAPILAGLSVVGALRQFEGWFRDRLHLTPRGRRDVLEHWHEGLGGPTRPELDAYGDLLVFRTDDTTQRKEQRGQQAIDLAEAWAGGGPHRARAEGIASSFLAARTHGATLLTHHQAAVAAARPTGATARVALASTADLLLWSCAEAHLSPDEAWMLYEALSRTVARSAPGFPVPGSEASFRAYAEDARRGLLR